MDKSQHVESSQVGIFPIFLLAFFIPIMQNCVNRLEIPRLSQVAKGDHRRSYVHESTRFDHDIPLLDELRMCFGNPEEAWDGIVQLVYRMACTHAPTEAQFVVVIKKGKNLKYVASGRGTNNTATHIYSCNDTLRIRDVRYNLNQTCTRPVTVTQM